MMRRSLSPEATSSASGKWCVVFPLTRDKVPVFSDAQKDAELIVIIHDREGSVEWNSIFYSSRNGGIVETTRTQAFTVIPLCPQAMSDMPPCGAMND